MSGSQSAQIDEQPIIFQEQEVLWAKVRGYPWWPAFVCFFLTKVDKVHGDSSQNDDDEIEYTVNFFGDNTHSRLDGSKLRRYVDCYTEFYPKAKINRKLNLSILKAEEKLKQNGVNTDLFQNLRDSLKKPKKGRGGFHRAYSKVSSQDHANLLHSQLSQFQKNKIDEENYHHHSQEKEEIQPMQEQQSLKKMTSNSHQQRGTYKRRGRKPKKVIQQHESSSDQQQENNSPEQRSRRQPRKSAINEPIQLAKRTRSRKGVREVSYVAQQSKELYQQQSQSENNPSQPQQQKQEQSGSVNINDQSNKIKNIRAQTNKSNYPLRTNLKTKLITRESVSVGNGKKRGRPKKKVVQQKQKQSASVKVQQSDGQQQDAEPSPQDKQSVRIRPTGQNRISNSTNSRLQRVPRGRSLAKDIQDASRFMQRVQDQEQTQERSHPSKELILERIKFCLDKRDELIEYLDQLTITTNIIKDILQMNVTTILIDGGEISADMIRVLEKLKTCLIHRYFPEDLKMKRKYERINRKNIVKQASETTEESLDDIELRKKTILKIQKILKCSNPYISNAKQKSIQIESYFRKNDQSIGNSYKTMAYKVLRSLKDKIDTVDDTIMKLENGEYEQ